MEVSRRRFITQAVAGVTAANFAGERAATAQPQEKEYRACIIGDSKQGGFGHSFHRVFEVCPNVRVVGLADPDEAGRAKFAAEAKAERTYADYREMLDKEQPDLVAIAPRWTIRHREYLLACAAVGAHGIMEKPLAADLTEADEMVTAIEAKNLKWGIGFNFRVLPEVQHARKAIMEEGFIGDVLEVRGRGKEDYRAGGEDLLVLGTHIFDLMRFFLGDPQWVAADITVDGRPAVPEDRHEATEPLGSVAGDRVHAVYGFPGGVNGYFASAKNPDGNGGRWGLDLYGSKGMVTIRQNGGANLRVLRDASWAPGGKDVTWERIPGESKAHFSNLEAERYLPIVSSVLACIGTDRLPEVSLQDGRASLEMVQGAYAAHFSASRLSFPLQARKHPLSLSWLRAG